MSAKKTSISSLSSAKSDHRGTWNSGLEFLLSCISISIGLGNVWRFPNLAYENGGGAFLIPYFLVVFLVSKPLYYMELAFGQFASKSPVGVWACVPGFRGIGFAQMLSTFFLAVFYNYIMSISLFYLFASMQNPLPWVSCDLQWAHNDTCYDRGTRARLNISNISHLEPAPEQYFRNFVLRDAGSLEAVSEVDWRIALCLSLSWTLVALATVRGVQSLGKVVYVTASYPYIVLIALLILSLTMEGSVTGIVYFFTPQWEKLADVKVWYKAAEQSFFSLNTGFGHLIMYASYNNFKHKINVDALVISVADTMTSILAGCVVFSVLGTLSFELGKDIGDVVGDGDLHLAFVAYPEALGRIGTVPQLWSILFFIMLYMLGLGSSIGHVEAILTTIKDELPVLHKYKSSAAILCCVICFVCGLPLSTNSGQYIMKLMNNYGVGAAVFLYGILEFVGLMWIYGWRKFCDDVYFMLGEPVNIIWKIVWAGIAPVTLIVIYVYGTVQLIVDGSSEVKGIPWWGTALGWAFAALCVGQILLWFIICFIRSPEGGSLSSWSSWVERLKSMFRPTADWGPKDPKDRENWLLWKHRLVKHQPVLAYENPAYHI